MTFAILAAAAAALSFRVVPLACSSDRLAISGGGVLRTQSAAVCAGIVPGRAIVIGLDGDGRAAVVPPDRDTHPAADIPAAAYAIAPATATASSADVTVTIEITVPAETAPNSAIYVSTERTSFNPSEVRADQLDARRYRLQLRLRDGAQLAFRVTRGSFNTIERDARGRIPPPHVIVAHAGVTLAVTVAGWADDS